MPMVRKFLLLTSLSFAVACSSAPDEHLGTATSAVMTVCGASPNGAVQGRDVSYYQGNFDWNAQKGAGVSWGYARVSDGTGFIDPTFGSNWTNMKNAGILRGAYMFFEPGEDATQQGNLMVQKVGMLGNGDLPAMIDVETTGGQAPATVAARIQTWLDIVEKGTGRRPIIYTGPYFWQDNVQSTSFGKYGLWIAHYGVSCPLIPPGWNNWIMWQYSDGGGSLDHDVFNGTLPQLQALARPPDQPPRGFLDSVDCSGEKGWAQDQDTPTQAIDVHLYFNGPAGDMNAHGIPLTANQTRMDLCSAIGSCDHGFSLRAPRSLLDNMPHAVHAYGIDSTMGFPNAELSNSPKNLTCPAPPLGNVVRRWVVDQNSFGAWKFDAFMDVTHYSSAILNTAQKGLDFPAAPKLAQGDDGSPEVWVLDGQSKRHVVNPDSLAAWRFDPKNIVKTPAAQLKAMTQGPDWPLDPLLVQGDGPAIEMLDVPPQTPPGGNPPGNPGNPGSNPPDGTMPKGGGGCNASGSPANAAWFALLGLALVRRKRRCRGCHAARNYGRIRRHVCRPDPF